MWYVQGYCDVCGSNGMCTGLMWCLFHVFDPQEQRQLTHENVQRKQARTGEERDEEDEEQPSESESEDEDNEIIYNPKNLPLGWDGKVGAAL